MERSPRGYKKTARMGAERNRKDLFRAFAWLWKTFRRPLGGLWEAFWRAFGRPLGGLWELLGLQEAPRGAQEAPKRPQEALKVAQEAPKRAPRGAQELSEGTFEAPLGLISG